MKPEDNLLLQKIERLQDASINLDKGIQTLLVDRKDIWQYIQDLTTEHNKLNERVKELEQQLMSKEEKQLI